MRLAIIAIGRLKAGPERELSGRYHQLSIALGRSHGIGAVDLVEMPESRARRSADRRAEEARALLAEVPPGAALTAYDERGRSDLSSEALAERFIGWRDGGRPAICTVIGGPDGLEESVRARADLVLGFGRATLAHGLVRVLAFEQVYRTLTIVAGHPYHRGEA